MCLVDIPGKLVGFFVRSFVFEKWSVDLGKKGCVLGERAQGGMEERQSVIEMQCMREEFKKLEKKKNFCFSLTSPDFPKHSHTVT